MPFEVEETGETERTVRIRVSSEQLRGEVQRQLSQLSQRVEIPGFRKGKVPRSLLLKRYGDAVKADAGRELIENEYREAIKAHHFRPVESPQLDEEQFAPDEDGGIAVELKVEVLPPIELGDYKGLPITIPEVEVKEETLDAELEKLRRDLAKVEGVTDEPIEAGDYVKGGLTWQFFDGSTHGPTPGLVDTSSGAVDGLPCEEVREKAPGIKTGETFKVTVDLPEGMPLSEERKVFQPHLGQSAVVSCEVEEVHRVILPDPESEEFLGKFQGIETLAELRDRMRKDLGARMAAQRDRLVEDLCLDKLLDSHPFPLPAALLQRSIEHEQQRVRNQMEQRGAEPAEIEHHLLEIEGRLQEQTERNLRSRFLLDLIAERESLDVQNEEIETHFMLMSRALQTPPEELFEQFREAGTLPDVVAGIRRDKARRLLRTSAAETEMEGEKDSPSPTASEEAP